MKTKKKMQDGGAKNKKYKNPQDGRVKNKADSRAVILDKIKTGPLSSESYQKRAEYANWTNKPRIDFGTVDSNQAFYPESKPPIWSDPKKSRYSKGGSSKSTVKKQVAKLSPRDRQKIGVKYQSGGTSGGYPESGGKMMKTGGMVNPNANLQAGKKAGSKGVKHSLSAKAIVQKIAKGKSGGTSAAPKTALPKAKYGMTLSKKQKGGPSDAADAMIAQQLKSRAVQKGMNQARVAAKKGKAGKI